MPIMSVKKPRTFKKKNLVLRKELETFLYWRIRHFKPEPKLTDASNLSSTGTKKEIFKTFYLPFSTSNVSAFFSGSFFPEKYPFMQFWIFPFVGACLLSFQSIEKSSTFSKTGRFPSFDWTHESNQKNPIPTSNVVQNTKPSLFFGTPDMQSIQSEGFLGSYASNLQNNTNTKNNRLSSVAWNVENLCRFYLNVTEHNLGSRDSFENFYRTLTNSKGVFEKQVGSAFQYQNTRFLRFWYPLIQEPSVVSTKNQIVQKFQLRSFYKNLLRPPLFSENNLSTTSFLRNDTIQNSWAQQNIPIFSYYENAMLFENLLTQLKISNCLKAKSPVEYQIVKKFENDFNRFEKTQILECLQTLYRYESSNESFGKGSFVLSSFLKNATPRFYSQENILKNGNVPQKNQRRLRFKQQNLVLDKPVTLWERFHEEFQSDVFKIWSRNYIKKNPSEFFSLERPATNSALKKQQFLFFKKLLKSKNISRFNKRKEEFSNLKSSSRKNLRVFQNSYFLKTFDAKRFLSKPLLFDLNKLFFLKKVKNEYLAFRQNQSFRFLNKNEWTIEKSNGSSLRNVQNQLTTTKMDLLVLNTWRHFLANKKNGMNFLKQPFRFDETKDSFSFVERKTKKAFPESSFRNQTKQVQEFYLSRKFLNLESKLSRLIFENHRLNKQFNDFERESYSIFEYKTPFLKSSMTSSMRFEENQENPKKSMFPAANQKVARNKLSFLLNPDSSQRNNFYSRSFSQSYNAFETQEFPNSFRSHFSRKVQFDLNALKKNLLNPTNRLLFGSKSVESTSTPFSLKKLENSATYVRKFTTFEQFDMNGRSNLFEVYQKSTLPVTNNTTFDTLKIKKNKKKQSILRIKQQSRKPEKIFRTYASVKFIEKPSLKPENLKTKTLFFKQKLEKTSVDSIVDNVLKHLKHRILTKNLQHRISSTRLLKLPLFRRKKGISSQTERLNKTTRLNEKQTLILNRTGESFLETKTAKKTYFDSIRVSHPFVRQFLALPLSQKSTFALKDDEVKRFEQKTSLQKKRRFKKLKLENRRRKKRKRFYPRPHLLRSKLFFSFLNKRYKKPNLGNEKTLDFNRISNLRTNSEKETLLKQKVYRQEKNWRNSSNRMFHSQTLALRKSIFDVRKPIYHNQNFYRISNETLIEFERLCWKSYWLRSNITSYIRRIQRNLQTMKNLEKQQTSFFEVSNVLNKLNGSIHPTVFSKPNSGRTSSQNATPKQLQLYFNSRETITQSLLDASTLDFTKRFQNNIAYDQYLYERISNEIKNVKNQLNVEGQMQPRSYKVGRKKIEPTNSKSWFEAFVSFQNRYFEPKLFRIPEKKPPFLMTTSNELPTLRVLWALNKSQLFTHKENDFSKQLWSSYKRREQLKNNKTRKLLMKFVNKRSFDSTSSKITHIKQLSERKTRFSTNKIQALGGFTYVQNYQAYLRRLKWNLGKTSFGETAAKEKLFENVESSTWFHPNLETKVQKQKVHFWWMTKALNPIEFKPYSFNVQPFVSTIHPTILENANFAPEIQNTFEQEDFTKSNSLGFLNAETAKHALFVQKGLLVTFWVSCVLFHVALFFTFLRIPEIRSVLKFQFLLLTKCTNVYLLGLFSFYEILTTYKRKIKTLIDKTNSVVFEKKQSIPIESKIRLIRSWKSSIRVRDVLSDRTDGNGQFRDENPKREFVEVSIFNRSRTERRQKRAMHMSFLYDYRFRGFFDFVKNFEKRSPDDSKQKDQTRFETSYLNRFLSNAIPPFVFSLNPDPLQNSKRNAKGSSPNNWFENWYTGYLWHTFSTKIKTNVVQKTKEKYLREQAFSSKNRIVYSKGVSNATAVLPQKSLGLVQSMLQMQAVMSLSVLCVTKISLQLFYLLFILFYNFVFKVIDCFESVLLIFYKFLEKPAELMVAWIADVFLIEWSADVKSYVPDAFDQDVWTSVFKFSRSLKLFGNVPFGFLSQRFFLNATEVFYYWLLKSDKDLILRQKKGIIFWDVWAELLIQAAEKYKMNLSSLNTIREEQQLLIENLIENKPIETSKNPTGKRASESFLTSETFKASISKMKPLFKFLETQPLQPQFERNNTSKNFAILKNPTTLLAYSNRFSKRSLKPENTDSALFFQTRAPIDYWTRWSINQSLTIQGRETDLFLELHPSKSFSSVHFLKTYLPAQEILGSLVCDIYSGLFQQRVAKNILIVGALGMAKSSFVQALAGETELKTVIDNAHRYSFVSGGVPVGMKLLREVFDSISLYTPCLFVLEDIHIIGERRPMLLFDDDVATLKENAFGSEQNEVQEKNKAIYQFSRHALSHYKKPYKGDFSSSIPTNHFCYDLFLGIAPPRKRRSNRTAKSPLPLSQIERSLVQNEGTNVPSETSFGSSSQKSFAGSNLLSVLELSSTQIFAPPATSPFNILLMKEQNKLKPKKVVKEIPWSGFSYDQYLLISKTNYSVRVKVSLLAELAMNNLSVKLDMITDLLVIIDSVRSNRGFVVFGTTHVPALLDPALRRPGRFDETISLPLLPNFSTRFEICRTKLESYTETSDFFDLSLLLTDRQQNENQLSSYLSRILLLLVNKKRTRSYSETSENTLHKTSSHTIKGFDSKTSDVQVELFDYSISSVSQAFQASFIKDSSVFRPTQLYAFLKNSKKKPWKETMPASTNQTLRFSRLLYDKKSVFLNSEKNDSMIRNENNVSLSFANTEKLNYVSAAYSHAGQFLIEALVLRDQRAYTFKNFQLSSSNVLEHTTPGDLFKILYRSNLEGKNTLLKLFAGKIAEFFVLHSSPKFNYSFPSDTPFESNRSFVSENLSNATLKATVFEDSAFRTNPSQMFLGENIHNFQNYWQSCLFFVDAFFQKRFLYDKNRIVSKLLFFEENQSLRQPPSPPNSSILMPAKKFENYQRTLKDFIQKPLFTIHQKLQTHQKQRFLKLLYKIPVQTKFASTRLTNKGGSGDRSDETTFYSSFKELSYLDPILSNASSSMSLYQTRFLTRSRFSFLNQWWNGQFAEHTVETTYLSHVDWRSMFVQSFGDLVIDFPDADQYYNPRTKRWFLNSVSWNSWFDFEKTRTSEISQYHIQQCFLNTSVFLNSNREILDFLAFRFLKSSCLKEIDLLETCVRFYKD